MNFSNLMCNETAPPTHRPSSSAWCSIQVDGNNTLSSLFQSCCGTPVASYNYIEEPLNCWQYCNFTETSIFTNQTVKNCISDKSGYDGIISCGSAQTSASISVRASKTTWAVLGIAVVGMFLEYS
jgi:hypothetical protein